MNWIIAIIIVILLFIIFIWIVTSDWLYDIYNELEDIDKEDEENNMYNDNI